MEYSHEYLRCDEKCWPLESFVASSVARTSRINVCNELIYHWKTVFSDVYYFRFVVMTDGSRLLINSWDLLPRSLCIMTWTDRLECDLYGFILKFVPNLDSFKERLCMEPVSPRGGYFCFYGFSSLVLSILV